MRKTKMILWMAAAALLAQTADAFTAMDITRVLLMNDDTNETWAVSGQGYINTNDVEDATYWIHEGDPEPSTGVSDAIKELGLLDGTRHTFYAKLWDEDRYVTTPLWQLENCRAGNAATTNRNQRHFIPWSSTAVPRDGIGAEYERMTIISNWVQRPRPGHWEVITNMFYDFSQVATVNMQNTTNSFVISPYYKDGIGVVYFDFVNGWRADSSSEIQIQISTGTNGLGHLSFAEETNYSNLLWRTQKFDVFSVRNGSPFSDATPILSAVSTGVSAFTPNAPNEMFYGDFFYRARSLVNLHVPARFRIWRSKRYTSSDSLDTTAYLMIDNIVASYPPVEVEIKQYGKYDGTRRGAAVLGQEGVFDVPFACPGDSVRPWAYYVGKICPYVETSPEDFTITSPRFYYRWRYLDQIVDSWKSVPMSKSGTSNLVTIARNALKLNNDIGDIEYYYTFNMTKAPHYEPFDFCVGLAEPYGVGWAEDKTAWVVTNRRDYAEGIIPATQGTDWFTRIREGTSDCREVVLTTSKGDPGVEEERLTSSVQMELVDNHSWRAYLEVHKKDGDVGKSLRFRLVSTTLSTAEGGGFDSVTEYWAPSITTNNVLPCSAVSTETDTGWGEIILDGQSGHMMVEYNDATHAVTLTRAEYQNFNLWTDANREGHGYVGHSIDTNSPAMSGVSPDKRAYAEMFDKWEPKEGKTPYWVEHFIVPLGDTGYPYNTFYSKHKTPNGWAAENLMFIGEQYSAAYVTNGMALQLEGRGKGFIQYADAASMPDGLDTVSFTARAAQFLDFDDFAYYLDGNTLTDYAVGAQITMSTTGRDASQDRRDWSPGAPSLSLVGYYRATKGCYELRFTRVTSTQIEVALYRWNKNGRAVTATPLYPNGQGKHTLTTANVLLPTGSSMNQHNNWTGAYMALYNGTDRTYITVAMSSTPSTQTLAQDASNNRFTTTFTFQDTSEDRHVKGSFGIGSCDCPGRFGRIAQYNVSLTGSGSSAKVTPTLSTEASTAAEMGDEDNWALPPGRMEMITAATELYTWNYGIKASMPEQSVNLYLAKTGSGNDWTDSGYQVAVTSFVAKAYEISPRMVEKYNVRLGAGGGENDARTDVVLDDIELSQWHAGSWGDWAAWTYPVAYTNWVYEQCWVEELAEFSDITAYTLKTLSDTEEFVYTFTNSCTFTPTVDLELNRLLLVGGGGGGGAVMGGGGGGGCVTDASPGMILRAGNSYTITVGAGGTAITGSNQNAGGAGGESSFKLNGATLYSARGGGGGQGWGQAGTAGGNSGGSANRRAVTAVTSRDGEYGGHKGGTSGNGRGGGGGGAGADGGDPDHGYTAASHATRATKDTQTTYASRGGDGGDGVISDITGSAVYYGGGGGGGVGWTGTGVDQGKGGEGGKGGGGRGSNAKEVNQNTRCAEAGADGLGGGGGGGTWWDTNGREGNTGGRGGSGVVILRLSAGGKLATMQPRRAKANSPVMIRSPYLNGISLFSFTFANADPNAKLILQMATNSFGTADFRQLSQSLTDDRWINVTNFTFASQSEGTYTCFFGLREPIYGFVRLLCDPEIVQAVSTNDEYAAYAEYGAVTINSAVAYDEPILDDRSWFGWNMRTSDETQFAYLPDPAYNPSGLSGALNFTGSKDEANIANFADELDATNGAYAVHDPFVQSPAIYNETGVGQVQFRARVLDTNSTVSSWVSVYGCADPQNADSDEDWVPLKNIEVTNRTFRTFMWKTTDDVSPYKAVRLTVKAAKYGRNGDTTKEDGTPLVAPIQRVLIDEVAVSEPIAPGISFASISPIRTKLDQSPVKFVPDARSMDEQPLLGESFGVQVEVAMAQLADELDVDSIRVFMAYYPGVDLWGYVAWSNAADAVTCELVRCTDSNMVWRSAYASGYENSVIPPQPDPGDGRGVVMQYYIWAEYLDTTGTNHSHRVLSTEWSNPNWYYPIDYNKDNGGYADADKFCPYTILQNISPKRAWINCLNIFDGDANTASANQFLELAVPSGVNLEGWYLRFTEKSLGNTTRFATLGESGIKAEKVSTNNVYNSYDFLTIQAPATTTAKGYAADGTWFGFSLEEDSGANGSFRYLDSYAVELIRPNGIIEHQVVFGGTNEWEEYVFWPDYDPGVLRDKLVVRDAGTGASWILAGKDQNNGSLGVMVNHGAITNDWEANLVQTPEARNKRRNGTYQNIPADWYLPSLGTNCWIFSYIYGDHIAQRSGNEEGSAIRLIVPQGTTTNITYTVEPWYRIATITSNDVSISAPSFNPATYTYNLTLRDVSTNMNFKVTSGVDPKVDALIPPDDPYHNAVVKWLEHFGAEREIIPAEMQLRYQDFKDHYLSLKEMYWMDIYPFQTNRLIIGVSAPTPIAIPDASIDYTAPYPAYTNVRLSVYMMITNRETGECHAPYTIQGLNYPDETSVNYSDLSPNWTSATFKVVGNLMTIEGKWRPLRYFVFDNNSFNPPGHVKEYEAEVEVWDPFSSKSPIYTDPDVRWWPYRGINPVFQSRMNEELKPVRVRVMKPNDVRLWD
jgi:hypothetical protein